MPVLSTGFPTNPAGQLSLYTKDVSGRSTVFYKKDNSSTQWQLTGIDPSSATSGYTYLPGGLLIQWGVVAGPFASGAAKTVTFPVAFDATAYSVVDTAWKDSGSTNSNFIFIVNGSISATEFKAGINGSDIRSFTWIAIGPKA